MPRKEKKRSILQQYKAQQRAKKRQRKMEAQAKAEPMPKGTTTETTLPSTAHPNLKGFIGVPSISFWKSLKKSHKSFVKSYNKAIRNSKSPPGPPSGVTIGSKQDDGEGNGDAISILFQKQQKQHEHKKKKREKLNKLEQHRKRYDEQLEKGEINYGYPCWDYKTEEKYFTSCSPESLVGTYDVIYMACWKCDERQNKSLNGATLTIIRDGENICGIVRGRDLTWGNFEFEGKNKDFSILAHTEYNARYIQNGYDAPVCNLDIFADRVVCRWTPDGYEDHRTDSPVPKCDTIEEANAFIAKQQTVIDANKSWIHNHLELPATAVSLIHEYAKAWTPPRPFFFFEKGDLRIKAVWAHDPREGITESQYVARRRSP